MRGLHRGAVRVLIRRATSFTAVPTIVRGNQRNSRKPSVDDAADLPSRACWDPNDAAIRHRGDCCGKPPVRTAG